MKSWAALLRPGDWLMLAMIGTGVVWLAVSLWRPSGAADRVLVRSGGAVIASLDLARDRALRVMGPLGVTEIEVKNQRVRVARDPSPLQYCVQQGWLARAGEAALCLPNQVSVQLTGRVLAYDSRNF